MNTNVNPNLSNNHRYEETNQISHLKKQTLDTPFQIQSLELSNEYPEQEAISPRVADGQRLYSCSFN